MRGRAQARRALSPPSFLRPHEDDVLPLGPRLGERLACFGGARTALPPAFRITSPLGKPSSAARSSGARSPATTRSNISIRIVADLINVCGASKCRISDSAVIYFLRVGISMQARRRRRASIRTNPGRRDLLLPPLRSTLFGDAFAAFQDRQQPRKMRGLPADNGQAGFDQGFHLQAYSPA
jgi:hypothetical protein